MPYLLTDFNGVALPRAMPEDDLSTGRSDSTLAASIGGVYDTAGGRRRYPYSHEFSHRGLYEAHADEYDYRVTTTGDYRVTTTGDNRIVANNPFADLEYLTDTLKAQIGIRGQLWRQAIYGSARQWKQCRLLQVNHVETVDEAGAVSEVESLYETNSRAWKAAAVSVVNANAISGAVIPLLVDNYGLLPVSDGVLTIARTSGTITSVTIVGSAIDLAWSGSLGAGQTLTIDAGSETVTIGGVDAYSGFTLGPAAREWLALAVGANNVLVTIFGGNATITLSYYQQWP